MTGTTSYPLTDAALQCDECCPNCADFAHKLERALAEAEKTIEMGNYYEQGKCEKFKAERDQLQRELAEAKNHGVICEVCNWTNVGCLKVQGKWTCHGCIDRGFAERDQLRADLDKAMARLVEAKGEA